MIQICFLQKSNLAEAGHVLHIQHKNGTLTSEIKITRDYETVYSRPGILFGEMNRVCRLRYFRCVMACHRLHVSAGRTLEMCCVHMSPISIIKSWHSLALSLVDNSRRPMLVHRLVRVICLAKVAEPSIGKNNCCSE